MSPAALSLVPTDYRRLALACLAPPSADDCWAWCSKHLVMPGGNRWDPRRALVFRHWYRLAQARLSRRPLADDPWAHRCEELYLVAATQLAKTTFLLSLAAYMLATHPRKTAIYYPRLADLADARRARFERMVLAMPAIESLLPRGEAARDQALSARLWTVGTSLLFWLCGCVYDDLRSQDYQLILGDEFDRWDLGADGDPVEHARARQRTYRPTRLLAATSTPGVVSGHAWRRLCSGSHERLLVACPDCGAEDWLDPRCISLAGDRALRDVHPTEILGQRLARYACRWCGCHGDARALHQATRQAAERDRWCPGTWAITAEHPAGHWIANADRDTAGRIRRCHPAETVVRSGWANALYSLDVTLDEFAAGMALAAQGTPSAQQTFTNNDRAEPWVVTATDADPAQLAASVAADPVYRMGQLHRTAKWLFLMLDQQNNEWTRAWFPWVLRAFEPGGESWLVDAGQAKDLAEVELLLARTWPIGDTERKADLVGMDSANGNVRFQIYLWAAQDPARRLLLRGDPRLPDDVPWQVVEDKLGQHRRTPKPHGVREYRVHPYHWRTELWERLRGRKGPAWWRPDHTPAWYNASLTAEEQVLVKRRVAGGAFRDQLVWQPRLVASTAGRDTFRNDNHWWDAEVGALAAANILLWDRSPSTTTPRRRYGAIGAIA